VSHHVIVGLPDGRAVRVDYRVPVIVPILRRINYQASLPRDKIDYDALERDDLAAAAWLDRHPDLTCTAEQVRDGTCTRHG
jgi:hypothetical protein